MSLYLTNRDHYFFEIRSPVKVDQLQGVTIYSSKDEMFEAVSAATGEPVEDLENATILVRGEDGEYEECDHRGIWSDIDLEGETLERWVSDYEL